ncbi:hypothetical protein BT69DRAFT_782372 [Atractiella rhizophila]|nr:hypothetical protein BT69DRAFT_782372 [Atractiella rhizophila]
MDNLRTLYSNTVTHLVEHTGGGDGDVEDELEEAHEGGASTRELSRAATLTQSLKNFYESEYFQLFEDAGVRNEVVRKFVVGSSNPLGRNVDNLDAVRAEEEDENYDDSTSNARPNKRKRRGGSSAEYQQDLKDRKVARKERLDRAVRNADNFDKCMSLLSDQLKFNEEERKRKLAMEEEEAKFQRAMQLQNQPGELGERARAFLSNLEF